MIFFLTHILLKFSKNFDIKKLRNVIIITNHNLTHHILPPYYTLDIVSILGLYSWPRPPHSGNPEFPNIEKMKQRPSSFSFFRKCPDAIGNFAE